MIESELNEVRPKEVYIGSITIRANEVERSVIKQLQLQNDCKSLKALINKFIITPYVNEQVGFFRF